MLCRVEVRGLVGRVYAEGLTRMLWYIWIERDKNGWSRLDDMILSNKAVTILDRDERCVM